MNKIQGHIFCMTQIIFYDRMINLLKKISLLSAFLPDVFET